MDRHLAAGRLPIEIVHASEYITMEDKVEAIRAKRDSSMRVDLRMVREGQAAGFVTAGNTGAAMATAKVVLGAVPGLDRPALAAVFPTAPGNPAMLLDVGANVDCTPQNLLLPDKLWRFVWREPAMVEPLFVWALFQTPTLRREIGRRATGTSGSMKNISQEKVRAVRLRLLVAPQPRDVCQYRRWRLLERALPGQPESTRRHHGASRPDARLSERRGQR